MPKNSKRSASTVHKLRSVAFGGRALLKFEKRMPGVRGKARGRGTPGAFGKAKQPFVPAELPAVAQ
jgi:hypothetical protein